MASKLPQSEQQELRIVLIGKTGVGKSAAGNTILRKEKPPFPSKLSSSSLTTKCKKEKGEFGGQSLAVIDTPGLFPTTNPEGHPDWFDSTKRDEVLEEVIKCISFAAPGPHVFLVVLQLGTFTPEEQKTVEIIQGIFGKEAEGHTMVLFTHGDDLQAEGGSVEEIIGENQNLSNFIQTCHGGYHVFNNRDKDPSQVAKLLQKIKNMVQRKGGKHYTNEMLQEAEKAIREEMKRLLENDPKLKPEDARKKAEKDNDFIKELGRILIAAAVSYIRNKVGGPVGAAVADVAEQALGSSLSSDLRVVLVGQERVGKSAAGNTILGRREFVCSLSFKPVTLESERREGDVLGRRVTVVDTPGLFSSQLSEKEVKAELEEALLLSAPGPHAFLLTLQLGRFTEQEQKGLETLEKMLCPAVRRHTIVLFTYGDRLGDTDIEQFITEDENLKKLVQKCGGRYHVFDNKVSGNTDQVRELLDKIDSISKGGNSYYVRSSLQSKVSALISRVSRLFWAVQESKYLKLVAGIFMFGSIYVLARWMGLFE